MFWKEGNKNKFMVCQFIFVGVSYWEILNMVK
ncbi:Uncharacterised protein [Streptococcus dysgalactiae subsp. equisimilis]|nr:Uncharacterised protein [Streptococcus dysgalactiae subsp. equisimilis]SQF77248.1 Uncharacterised protein [Streptococcus dysgalactiae subsp. equisimilis]